MAAKPHTTEGVGSKRRHENSKDRRHYGYDDGVPHPRRHIKIATAGENLALLAETKTKGNAKNLLKILQGRGDPPDIRRPVENLIARLKSNGHPVVDGEDEQTDDEPGDNLANDTGVARADHHHLTFARHMKRLATTRTIANVTKLRVAP